jgi:hypothetical protein
MHYIAIKITLTKYVKHEQLTRNSNRIKYITD